MTRALHPAARRVARGLANLVYRDIDIHPAGAEVPSGPTLAVANHFGGLADGVLLVDALPRMPRVVARDVIWRIPVVGRLATALGGIPVHRAADGGRASNDEMFRSCYDALAEEDLVLIFPEGVTQDVPHMAQVRTGAARIALGARASGVTGLSILPLGIHYEDKAGFRSRALVHVGTPIDLDAWVGDRPGLTAEDREAVAALTQRIDAELRAVAPDFPDWATARSLATAADVLLDDVDPGPQPIRYGDRELLANRLNRLPGPDHEQLVATAADYRASLADRRTSDRGVLRALGRARRSWAWVVDLVLVVLLGPYALAGLLAAALPLALVLLASRAPLAPAVRATAVPAVALLGFLGAAVLSGWSGFVVAGVEGAAAAPVLLVFFVGCLFLVAESASLLLGRWRTRRTPRGAAAAELQAARTGLAEQAWRLL